VLYNFESEGSVLGWGNPSTGNFIVPTPKVTANVLQSFESCYISVQEGRLVFSNDLEGGFKLTIRPINEKFPNVEYIIPSNFTQLFKFDKKGISAAIKDVKKAGKDDFIRLYPDGEKFEAGSSGTSNIKLKKDNEDDVIALGETKYSVESVSHSGKSVMAIVSAGEQNPFLNLEYPYFKTFLKYVKGSDIEMYRSGEKGVVYFTPLEPFAAVSVPRPQVKPEPKPKPQPKPGKPGKQGRPVTPNSKDAASGKPLQPAAKKEPTVEDAKQAIKVLQILAAKGNEQAAKAVNVIKLAYQL